MKNKRSNWAVEKDVARISNGSVHENCVLPINCSFSLFYIANVPTLREMKSKIFKYSRHESRNCMQKKYFMFLYNKSNTGW